MSLRRTVRALAGLLRSRRVEREMEDEIAAHLEMAERDALARGLPPEEARRAARLAFGGVQQVREAHRERRGFARLEMLARDARYGLAAIGRAPGFSAVVIGVLALGIGANLAMFSVLDAVLLKPLPFPEPDRIVRIWDAPRPGALNATSTPDFLDWKRLGTVFEALSAERPASAALNSRSDPAKISGKLVTSDYFRVFGSRAALGRTFLEDDHSRTVVLSHGAWRNRFASDPQILQRPVMLDGEPHQVIGVLRPGAFDRDRTEFWKPLVFAADREMRGMHWLTVYGRLRPDATLERARERMLAIHATLLPLRSVNDREGTILVEPLARLMAGRNLRKSVQVAFGAVALVLLIACANVANLLLARGAARYRELAVRAALGAGRGRLVAQLLAETSVLCLVGGAAGVGVAALLLRAAKTVLRDMLPFTADVALDPRALAFALAISVAAALLAGMLPALRTSFVNLSEALHRGSRGSAGPHPRMRRAIVAGEVALSLVLLCGALLLLRSWMKLQQLDTGIRTENVLTMSLDLPPGAYPTPARAALFYEQLAGRLSAAPGIAHAGLTTHLPLLWIGNGEGVRIAGSGKLVRVRFKRVDAGYFRALGIPLLAGRGITSRDRHGAPPVMVINETLVTRLAEAGLRDPVGKVVQVSFPFYIEKEPRFPDVQIAGVIRSERVAAPGLPDPAVVYVPLAQAPSTEVKLLVRTHLAGAAAMPQIREAVREVDPNIPLGEIATMEQVRARTLEGTSRPASLIGGFAAAAMLLTAIGLYGVIALGVAQQRREIGIRMALGARSRDVVSRVLRNALALVIAGLALGLAGASALTRIMKNLLFGVDPLDPLALAAACLSMLLVALLAAVMPAARAARVDPVATLRDDG